MNNSSRSVADIKSLVFRAVGMSMAVAAIVLSILGGVGPVALVTLLGIGLFTMALDALDRGSEEESGR
jgi:hypothetical protein